VKTTGSLDRLCRTKEKSRVSPGISRMLDGVTDNRCLQDTPNMEESTMRTYTPRPDPHKGLFPFFLGMWSTLVLQLLMQ